MPLNLDTARSAAEIVTNHSMRRRGVVGNTILSPLAQLPS